MDRKWEHVEVGPDGVEVRAVAWQNGCSVVVDIYTNGIHANVITADLEGDVEEALRCQTEHEARLHTLVCSSCGARGSALTDPDEAGSWQCVECDSVNGVA